MLENLSAIITKVTSFTNQHKIDAEFHMHTRSELTDGSDQQNERWQRFEKSAGVYCIFEPTGKVIKYIGMSESDTGNRIAYWLFKENKIKTELEDEDIILSIVLKNEPYMASSLETYLIRELDTLHNVKRIQK